MTHYTTRHRWPALAAALLLGLAPCPTPAATAAPAVVDPAAAWADFLAHGDTEQMGKAYDAVIAVADGQGVDAGKCRQHADDFDRAVRTLPAGAGLWYYGYLCAKATGDSAREERYYANFSALATYAFGQRSDDPKAPPIRIAHVIDMDALVAATGMTVRYRYYEQTSATRYFPIHVALYDEQTGKERHFRFDQVDTLARVARDPSLYAKPGARLYLARGLAKQQASNEDQLGTDITAVWNSESEASLPAKLKVLRPAAQAGGLRALLRWRYLCRVAKDADCASEWIDMILPMAEEHEAYPTVLLALAYGEGQGVAQDTAAAMKLLADADAKWAPGEATVAYARQWLEDGDAEFPPELLARLELARAAGNPAVLQLRLSARIYDDKKPPLPADDLQALTAQAEQGLPSAMMLLAEYYERQKNMAAALPWLRRAAEAGNPDAQSSLASVLYFGDGVAKDQDAGLAWVHRAADGGDTWALRFLGNDQRDAGDWAGAEAYFAACAFADDLDCVYTLAKLYLGDHPGLQGDAQTGLTLLRQLDQNADSALARRALAELMIEGKRVKQDLLGARLLFEKDAQRGDTASQLRLGHALVDGELGARDEAGGIAWMQRAADGGNRFAAGELGYWLYYKRATVEARQQALAIWRKSVQADNDLSRNNLAWALCTSADPAVYEPQEGLKVALAMGDPATLDAGSADTVASCYAAAGQFDRAAEVQQQLLTAVAKAKEGDTDPADVAKFRARLAQYQRHERYVEPSPAPTPAPTTTPAPTPTPTPTTTP